ncbi:MAG: TetR/AcrR family transcriptional regulator [Candidatus Binatus sp.]|uniref:TetR/AcrR family transcriptional regulator n=1 Tax=Candidatus Binatus sp. TaxID=2811406 RepID=UPI0027288228|nr:TetR/AcrR family transcriptional regulator [Candidatus Binatus sp.]MDO8432758.1 TetR/AcrR family transcriptional regulator [Candidatus Binatus sp.]
MRKTLDTPKLTNGRPLPLNSEQGAKRERILNAALKLFAHEPYQAVTMDRVAKAANVAKGTLYLYFPSKDALYLGILSDGLDSAYRTYQASADPRLPLVERLRRAITVTVEFFDHRRDFLQFYATEEPRLAEARNRIMEEARERGSNFFASLIQDGIRFGVFAAVDPRVATLAIQGSIRSLLLYYGNSRPVAEISRELGDLMLKSLAINPAHFFKQMHQQ